MKRSIDTNVLVRLLADEDTEQKHIAQSVVADGALVLPTVVQEAIWVWQSRYGLSPAEICELFRELMTVPSLEVIDRLAVLWALDKFEQGGDFADMLHLASSRTADCFTTFDKRIARFADDAVVPVETLRA